MEFNFGTLHICQGSTIFKGPLRVGKGEEMEDVVDLGAKKEVHV